MKKKKVFIESEMPSLSDYPFIPLTIGETLRQPEVLRADGFVANQVLFVTDGEGEFSANGEAFHLSKGQGLFTRTKTPHSYRAFSGEFCTAWVTFLSGEELLSLYGVGDFFVFDYSENLLQSMSALCEACVKTSVKALRAAHGYLWMTEFLEEIFKKEESDSDKVIKFLEKNIERPVSLEEAAEVIGTDRYSLCRTFLKETGKTVMGALLEMRINRAKRMLRYSSYRIFEIAKLCGFEDTSYFIKIFRRETGKTPLAYRKK